MSIQVHATKYAQEFGWAVVPLMPRDKRPHSMLVRHGWKDASTDPAMVASWWRRMPDCNVGIACSLSGLLVIDVDVNRDADEDLRRWERQLGSLPSTVETITGSGGRHLYFQDPGVKVRGKLDEVEIKTRHFVVAPPSIHPITGVLYEWSVDGTPGNVAIAELPEAWVEALTEPSPSAPTRQRSGTQVDDPLLEISPLEYVPILTGRQVGRDGKVACPFHEDRSPSLHCYAEPAKGWFCFQCSRGGSIYDLYGYLAGVGRPLRGAVFLSVKEAVIDHLLGAVS